MKDSPFKGIKPPDAQVKGDFDALLNVSPREKPAQRQSPVVLKLRNSGSFKPQGSLDSVASVVSAASSAGQADTVRTVIAADVDGDCEPDAPASSSAAKGGAQTPTTATADNAASNGTAAQGHRAGSGNPSKPAAQMKAVLNDSSEAEQAEKPPTTHFADPLTAAGLPKTLEKPEHALWGTSQAAQQETEETHLSAKGQDPLVEPSRTQSSAEASTANASAAQPTHDDPLRSAPLETTSVATPPADQEPSESGAALNNEEQPSASAKARAATTSEDSEDPASGGSAEALERLQPRASAELPVSTLRAGRCFSGYASAEDEPPPGAGQASAEQPGSSGSQALDISADELALLAAASRAGKSLSGSHPSARSVGEAERQSGGAAREPPPFGSFEEDPSILAGTSANAKAEGGLAEEADEGQELGAWRGGSSGKQQPPVSIAGSSPDSHAASSLVLRSIHGDEARTASMQPTLQAGGGGVVQGSVGTSTVSDAGTADGNLDDECSVVEISELGSYTGDPVQAGEAAEAAEAAAARASLLGRAATNAAAEVGQNEDSAQWRSQRKHFFVLSNAGRPVFTAHGCEHALAGFMAIIDAMMSFVKDRGDALQCIRAGDHIFVFLERGPLYLVAVSSTGEPENALKLQLDLLHAHLLAILTDNFDRILAKNPRFEPRRLLGGTEDVLRRFLGSFETSPSAMLSAFEPVRLATDMRHVVLVALQSAIKRSEAMYGVLLAGDGRVVGLAQPRAHALHAADLLLLSSFVLGSDSFRAAAESFSPICLPRFNPSAFLHAYVHYLDPESGLCLVLLSARQDAFHMLADSAARLQRELAESGVPQAIRRTLAAPGEGRLHIPGMPAAAGGGAFGVTALQHFVYKAPARGQYLMAAFSAPLSLPELQQKVMPAYARVHAAMVSEGGHARQRVHFTRDSAHTVLAYSGAEYEVYALFDALVERPAATAICQRLCAWIKGQHTELFLPLSV